MVELLTRLPHDEFIGLVAIIGCAICGTLGLLFAAYYQWASTRRAEITASLKKDMLDRGMSAEEIRTVLEAGSHKPDRPVRQLSS
jgi:hypothetical protein